MSTAAIYWWGVMSQGARVARQRLPIGRCYGWSGPVCIRAHHYSGRRSHCEHTAENHGGKRLWALGLSGVVLGGTLYAHYRRRPLVAATYSKRVPGERVFGYKEYSVAEVAKHVTKEDRVWVTFRDGVYDITDFIDKHPGGENILLGAGGAVDPFWDIYGVHKKKEILDLLEEYRIGNLEETRSSLETINDPYDSDPPRHKALKPASLKPFNAEPPLQILADDFHTPNSLFYVRNHLPVPLIDPSEYKLEIEGIGIKGTKELTLDELKTKFPKVTITATLQCAGNRRSEQNKVLHCSMNTFYVGDPSFVLYKMFAYLKN